MGLRICPFRDQDRSLAPMAYVGAAGGGQGWGGAVGAGFDDMEPLHDAASLLQEFQKGKISLSVVLNDNSVVTLYLEKSGKVDKEELKTYGLPANYENPDQSMLDKIIDLINQYQSMGIKRRKILFLRLLGLRGVRGLSKAELLAQEVELIKDYAHEKDSVWEKYDKVKKVKAAFLREPDVFQTLPELLQ